jgi:hypothetical protein
MSKKYEFPRSIAAQYFYGRQNRRQIFHQIHSTLRAWLTSKIKFSFDEFCRSGGGDAGQMS